MTDATPLVASMAADERDKVAAYWSRNVAGSDPFGPEVFWLAVPQVQARFQRRACAGLPYGTWVDYVIGEFLRPRGLPARDMLSLGCGSGALERDLYRLGAFMHCDAYDIAPGAIEIAQREAAAMGATSIHYAVRDIQQHALPQGQYDAVWFNGSLHHIGQLEFVLDSVRDALRPGGYLFFNEYVGARHFEFPPRQREAIEAAFRMLPPRYRRSFAPASDGAHMLVAPLPDWQEVRATDPSEAIRSNEIMAEVSKRFEIVANNACGGSILQFLLSGLAGHFTPDDPVAMRYLDAIMSFEDLLIEAGDLASDFVVVAARPRQSTSVSDA